MNRGRSKKGQIVEIFCSKDLLLIGGASNFAFVFPGGVEDREAGKQAQGMGDRVWPEMDQAGHEVL